MITATGNGRIKNLVQLKQKSKARREQNVFVVEGIKMFLEAPSEKIREVYVSESFSKMLEKGRCTQAAAKLRELKRVECVSDEVFGKAADTKTPQGILCVVEQRHYNIEEMLQNPAPLLVVLEDLQDPGNLGTIMRTGEGAGITGVILTKESADLYNPKTVRATMGSIFRVPFLYTEKLGGVIGILKERRVSVYAAHLSGKRYYDEWDYKGSAAFLIGNEANGLSEETAGQADALLKIPMQGSVESLNAGVAASILMYEAARQRRIR